MDKELLTFAKAIADDKRQEIMSHLCCVWLNVSDIVEKMGGEIKQPTVSHHLKILEEANIVLKRQDGKQRFYTLNQEYMTVCCGRLVQSFAPDYMATLVTVDKIPVVKT